MPSSFISTAYPAAGAAKRSQRTPTYYITGSAVNNVGGVVMTRGNISSGDHTALRTNGRTKNYEQVVADSELGTAAIDTGTFPGTNTHKFKRDVGNRLTQDFFKFVKDVSQAYNSGGRWDYVTQQKPYKDVTLTGSELVTNGTFATDTTGWILSNADRTTDYGGEIHLSANTGVLSVDSESPIAVTALARYRISFEVHAITTPSKGLWFYTSTDNSSVFVNETGVHYIDIDIPVGTTTMFFTVGNRGDSQLNSEAWVDNFTMKKILTSEINTSFGTEAAAKVFVGGSNGASSRRTY